MKTGNLLQETAMTSSNCRVINFPRQLSSTDMNCMKKNPRMKYAGKILSFWTVDIFYTEKSKSHQVNKNTNERSENGETYK